MTDGTEAITRSAISLALDAATQRHQVLAANIAHANTEGFVARTTNFDSHLQEARRVLQERGRLDAQTVAALAASPPRIEPRLGATGQPAPVQLDQEVAEMAQNAVHYQALVRALSRQLSIVALAAGDGKR